MAGIAEPHTAVGLAHVRLHPGPQRLVGLLLLAEVNKQVLHAAQPSRLVANEEPRMSAWRGGPPCAQCSPSLIIPALRQEPACPPSMSATPGLPDAQARAAIEQVAAKLSERFGLKSSWTADVLNFSGSGVDGAIELQPGAVRVTAKLGFLLSAMKGMVEGEIQRVLRKSWAEPRPRHHGRATPRRATLGQAQLPRELR